MNVFLCLIWIIPQELWMTNEWQKGLFKYYYYLWGHYIFLVEDSTTHEASVTLACEHLATNWRLKFQQPTCDKLRQIFDRRMFGECWANDRQFLSILFHFKAYIRQILAHHSAIFRRFSAFFRRLFGDFSAIFRQRSLFNQKSAINSLLVAEK